MYVDNLFKETAEIETGMAGKSSWDQANRRQKLGLVWRIRKKISQIIKDYFYIPFYLLIILWHKLLRTCKVLEKSTNIFKKEQDFSVKRTIF
jgi:hypothetical protein